MPDWPNRRRTGKGEDVGELGLESHRIIIIIIIISLLVLCLSFVL